MIFLNSLFGYLCFLIILKWATGATTDLYHVLIYMFLKPGEIDGTGYAFPHQALVQNTLLIMAFVAVPWMLFPKPFILKARHDAAKRDGGGYQHMRDENDHEQGSSAAGHAVTAAGHGGGGHGDHEEFDFGEVSFFLSNAHSPRDCTAHSDNHLARCLLFQDFLFLLQISITKSLVPPCRSWCIR